MKKDIKKLNKKQGFSLIEVMIAVGLFAISRGRPTALTAAVFAFATATSIVTTNVFGGYRFDDPCKDRASETAALIASNLFLVNFVPHSENMFVWRDRKEILRNSAGCVLGEEQFGSAMAEFGMQLFPMGETLSASVASLIDGTNALAVPTADYRNVEHLIASFRKAGALPLEIKGKTKIKTAQFNFDLYVLGSQRLHSTITTNVPLDTVQAQPGSSLSDRGDAKMLVASAQQWRYAAIAPLSLPRGASGRAAVRVRLQVEEGKVGVGVLARDNASQVLAEQGVDMSGAPTEIDLELADVSKAGSIVLRSWSLNGVSARAQILSVTIAFENDPQPPTTRP